MTERPIIFNTQMVQAILESRKTQTRRIIKTQLEYGGPVDGATNSHNEWMTNYSMNDGDRLTLREVLEYNPANIKPFYGNPGDELWVRETWGVGSRPHPHLGSIEGLEYKADVKYIDDIEPLPIYEVDEDLSDYKSKWRPSIHMPRWASRIQLKITNISIERLQDISEEEVHKEGVEPLRCPECGYTKWDCMYHMDHNLCHRPNPPTSRPLFRELWDSINEKRGFGWEINPWVWVIEFERIKP